MRKNKAVSRTGKPKSWLVKLKIGLEWAFLLSALLVVIMPFTGMNTFARGNDFNRVFAGTIPISILQNVGNRPEEQLQLQNKVEEIADSVSSEASDVKKIKAVHDYLVRNTQYDYANYLNETVPMVSYTPYGALIQNVAVCQGYAMAFQMIMEEIGIPCEIVVSDEMKHAWNMVQLDNEWYHVDTTWDDPVPDLKDHVSYDNFLISDARIQDEEHQYTNWFIRNEDATIQEAPKATSTKYDSLSQRDWMYSKEYSE